MANENEETQEQARKRLDLGKDEIKITEQRIDVLKDLLNRERTQPEMLRDTQKGFQSLDAALRNHRKRYADIAQELAGLKDAIDELEESTDKQKLQKELETKASKARDALLTKGVVDSLAEIAKGVLNYNIGVYKAVYRDYQSGSSAYQFANDVMTEQINSTATTVKGVSGVVGGLSAGMAALSIATGGAAAPLWALAAAGSSLVSLITDKWSELAKFKLDTVTREMEGTITAYRQITQAGVLLADGLNELRNGSIESFLDYKQFAKIVSENGEILRMYGGSVTDGMRKFKEVNKAMDPYRQGLLQLGYTMEDVASGTMEMMRMQALFHKDELKTGRELAEETDRYMTNLKVIANYTGKDAKKLEDEANAAASQLAVWGKLRDLGGDADKKFKNIFEAMPDKLKQAFAQKFGTGALDMRNATMLSQIPGGLEVIDKGIALLNDSSIKAGADTSSRIVKEISAQTPRMLKGIEGASRTGIAQSAALNMGYQDLAGDLSTVAQELTGRDPKKDMTDAFIEAEKVKSTIQQKDKNGKPIDSLTQAVAKNEIEWQKQRLLLQKDLTPTLYEFNNVVKEVITGIRDKLAEWGIGTSSTTPAPGVKQSTVQDNAAKNMPASIERKDKTKFNPFLQPKQVGSPFGGGTSGSKPLINLGGSKKEEAPAAAQMSEADILSHLVFGGGMSGNKAGLDGLDPGVRGNFMAMVAEYVKDNPKAKIHFNSGFRTFEQQKYLWDNRDGNPNPVAPPGNSSHEKGRALDIDRGDVQALSGLLEKYGFSKLKDDPVHIQAMAKGGITDGVSIAGEAGPEAVIPLPDGRTIPVKMDLAELVDKLQELIDVSKDHKRTSDKIHNAVA